MSALVQEETKKPLPSGPIEGVQYPVKVVYCGGKILRFFL